MAYAGQTEAQIGLEYDIARRQVRSLKIKNVWPELQNVNFFTQLIFVQLNYPKKKRVNCEKFLTF